MNEVRSFFIFLCFKVHIWDEILEELKDFFIVCCVAAEDHLSEHELVHYEFMFLRRISF